MKRHKKFERKVWAKICSQSCLKSSILVNEEREFILPSRLQMQDCQMNNDSQTSIKPQ